MMHRAWSSIVEVPYCFSRSSVKFQGHIALKIVKFDPDWAFPDCNSSLNSPMAMKCCTQLETAKERCPIVFQGHLSNFKVTRYKTSPILTQIGRFRTIGQSQLSNPSHLPSFLPIFIQYAEDLRSPKSVPGSSGSYKYQFSAFVPPSANRWVMNKIFVDHLREYGNTIEILLYWNMISESAPITGSICVILFYGFKHSQIPYNHEFADLAFRRWYIR